MFLKVPSASILNNAVIKYEVDSVDLTYSDSKGNTIVITLDILGKDIYVPDFYDGKMLKSASFNANIVPRRPVEFIHYEFKLVGNI